MYPCSNDNPPAPAAQRRQMKRVNIQLSDEAHTRAKIIAVLKGVTLNDYLARIVEEAVQRDRKVLQQMPK